MIRRGFYWLVAFMLTVQLVLPSSLVTQLLRDCNIVDVLYLSSKSHNLADNQLAGSQNAHAQSASQTTFYFKNDTRSANTYWGVAGPTVDNSTDTVEITVSGATTAGAMHPIAGPIVPATTSDSVVGTSLGDSNADLAWYKTFIMPIASGTQFTALTMFQVAASFDESNAAANAYARAFAYVYDSGSNSNVQTLAGPTSHSTEIGTSDQGKIWYLMNAVGVTPYTTDNNDFLAVEIWVDFQHTTTTAYTCTFRWGGNTNIVDNTANTTPASRITISNTTVDTFDPLWLLPTNADHEVTPNAHQTGDSFQGGTWEGRRMSTTAGGGAELKSQAVSTSVGNWRMNTFVSPPLAAQTIPAGNWVIHMHGNESSTSANARFRSMIYIWKNDDSGIRGTIKSVGNASTEWGTATTNNQVEDVVAGSTVAVSAGDRLVLEMEAVTVTSSGAYTTNHRFGADPTTPGTSVYDSAILPPMNYSSTPTPLQFLTEDFSQTHYHFDEDNDGETHSAWTDSVGSIAEDTPGTYSVSTNFRLRIQIASTGGENAGLVPFLYYQTKSPPGSWTLVTNSSTDIQTSLSGNFDQNTATSRQLTDLTSSGWDFTAGRMIEDSGGTVSNTSMNAWSFTEFEWSLTGVNANIYLFKATYAGSDFGLYASTPEVTITAGSPLSVFAPAAQDLGSLSPGDVGQYTFGEPVIITDGGAGWSLTAVITVPLNNGKTNLDSSNVKLRKDGVVDGGSDVYTIWDNEVSYVSENEETVGLDTSRTVGIRSRGRASEMTLVSPSLQIEIPVAQQTGDYRGVLEFTVV
ncbi:MAG: hypothetical protein PHR51_00905 [Patescibacteria group bacterium]|nr:hypothetical protein [Patescibacteria group bacterium]